MPIDTYAICPCGNGKKIKFCKCKDSIHDMDRVLKMMDGGQMVPALDRLSAILDEHPAAAWALAIRGQLLLELREYQSLGENADRFIRLQPSNPLALTQRAAAQLFQEDLDAATDSMVEALTESGKSVDMFVLGVASILSYALLRSGNILTARCYATLAMIANDDENGRAGVELLDQLNRSPEISLLLKSMPRLIDRPSDAEWGERFDEARALLRSNKIGLAQTKFESLSRVAAAEPSVLSGLLTCAIWRGDQSAQANSLRKLSECESLSETERVRYRAMSELVAPDRSGLSVSIVRLETPVTDADEVEAALESSQRVSRLPSDLAANMRQPDDEVAARSVFQVLDREKPAGKELPEPGDIPRGLALLMLYGKQTDRDAHLDVLEVRQENVVEVSKLISDLLPGSELTETDRDPVPFAGAGQIAPAMLHYQVSQAEASDAASQMTDMSLPEQLAHVPFPILNDRSLADTAQDDALSLERRVVMEAIDAQDSFLEKCPELTSKLRQIVGMEPPEWIKVESEKVDDVSNADLNRIDLDGLSDEALVYLLQRSQQVSATPLLRRVSQAVLDTEMAKSEPQLGLIAHVALFQTSGRIKEKAERMAEARRFVSEHQIEAPRLLLMDLQLRAHRGDSDGFGETLQEITSKYASDPDVMAELQGLLMAMGMIRPDGTPRSAPQPGAAGGGGPATAAPAASGGDAGLWTPDGAKSDGSESAPAGKLWVPGMD